MRSLHFLILASALWNGTAVGQEHVEDLARLADVLSLTVREENAPERSIPVEQLIADGKAELASLSIVDFEHPKIGKLSTFVVNDVADLIDALESLQRFVPQDVLGDTIMSGLHGFYGNVFYGFEKSDEARRKRSDAIELGNHFVACTEALLAKDKIVFSIAKEILTGREEYQFLEFDLDRSIFSDKPDLLKIRCVDKQVTHVFISVVSRGYSGDLRESLVYISSLEPNDERWVRLQYDVSIAEDVSLLRGSTLKDLKDIAIEAVCNEHTTEAVVSASDSLVADSPLMLSRSSLKPSFQFFKPGLLWNTPSEISFTLLGTDLPKGRIKARFVRGDQDHTMLFRFEKWREDDTITYDVSREEVPFDPSTVEIWHSLDGVEQFQYTCYRPKKR